MQCFPTNIRTISEKCRPGSWWEASDGKTKIRGTANNLLHNRDYMQEKKIEKKGKGGRPVHACHSEVCGSEPGVEPAL